MKVSVIMAVYNGEHYVDEAIKSILNQTFPDFEFFIINDGSTDGTAVILASFNEPRMKVFTQRNQGCVNATMRAINKAQGKYLAIMDADDISLPNRLERTVDFLDNHTDCVMVGTGYILRNEEAHSEITFIPPTDDSVLRGCLLRYDPFRHPSILIRASALKKAGGYNVKFNHGFDYELYSRLAKIGKLANIRDILLITRRHNQQFFRMGHSPKEHRKRRLKIRWLTLWRLHPSFPLFLRTLIWLCFEYFTHLVPDKARHKFPESFRHIFKTYLPPNV